MHGHPLSSAPAYPVSRPEFMPGGVLGPQQVAMEPSAYATNVRLQRLDSLPELTGCAPHLSTAADNPVPGLTPLRQESLDVLISTELLRTKTANGSQALFNDALEQLSAKEESLPMQAALYTLPSMQFLESLLAEMDTRSAHNGGRLAEPPLYLPIEAIDLPGLETTRHPDKELEMLGLAGAAPIVRRAHSAQAVVGRARSFGHDEVPSQIQPQAYNTFVSGLPAAGSAAPSPVRGPPKRYRPGPAARAFRGSGSMDDGDEDETYEADEMETSMQTSKSGRARKVISFSGNKRKAAALADTLTQASAPAALAGPAISEGTDSGFDKMEDSGDVGEVSKGMSLGSKGSRKVKRTVCLNCGSHQTPQWRCGPLGPRTLCNACGVRYKKGFPLNCWPLREGMVLPPGAVLPPSIQLPPGMRVITQPLLSD